MKIYKNLTEFREGVGEMFISEWIVITQEMINKFAEATLDFQWIHLDEERAKKESPFGGTTIAHGFLSVSMLSKFLEDTVKIESVKMGVNYGLDKVRFPSPVPSNAKLRLHVKIAQVEDQGPTGVKVFWDCTLEIEGGKKPACIATFISLAFE
jgi:acyl dehydratase